MSLSLKSSYRMHSGHVSYYEHLSTVTGTPMKFSLFLPEGGRKIKKTLLWLSGLTCTDENFMIKSGAQKKAQELDMAIICPDTSPRGLGLPGEEDSPDFGTGAGFYLDATEQPWSKNYRMHSYIMEELLPLLFANFPIDSQRLALSGHSMGGMGALVLGIRYPEVFHSLSALAPITNPSDCPWGVKAFTGYLGEDKSQWRIYDPTHLLEDKGYNGTILVHQGKDDQALTTQLKPDRIEAAATKSGIDLKLTLCEGYGHSYYFVASFIDEHLHFHNVQLEARP